MLIPGVLLAALGFADLSVDAWRGLVTLGMLMSAMMIWHRQLRHFVLLPSCVALIGGIMLILLNLRLMG
ncbi:PF07256 family protein [Klebsiella oxytoca KA-2]|nr:PF07256 family protein [Klebsiella oxytoca KA-2]